MLSWWSEKAVAWRVKGGRRWPHALQRQRRPRRLERRRRRLVALPLLRSGLRPRYLKVVALCCALGWLWWRPPWLAGRVLSTLVAVVACLCAWVAAKAGFCEPAASAADSKPHFPNKKHVRA